jgi:hypothetical protein
MSHPNLSEPIFSRISSALYMAFQTEGISEFKERKIQTRKVSKREVVALQE